MAHWRLTFPTTKDFTMDGYQFSILNVEDEFITFTLNGHRVMMDCITMRRLTWANDSEAFLATVPFDVLVAATRRYNDDIEATRLRIIASTKL